MAPTAEELAAHAFQFDTAALDKTLADFLQLFYTLSDDTSTPEKWADCFTEDAVFQKAATTVTGREAINKVNVGSLQGMKSRHHTVYRVYPYSVAGDEVMLYGRSDYVYDNGTTGGMGWAARLCFTRSPEGGVLIHFYHIFPSMPPKSA